MSTFLLCLCGHVSETLRDINKGWFMCYKTGWSDTQRPTLLSLVTFLGTASCGLLHLWSRNHVGWKSAVPFYSAKRLLPDFLQCCQAFFLLPSIFFSLIILTLLLLLLFCLNQEPKNMILLALPFFYSFCTTQIHGTDSKVTTLGFPCMNLKDAIQTHHR